MVRRCMYRVIIIIPTGTDLLLENILTRVSGRHFPENDGGYAPLRICERCRWYAVTSSYVFHIVAIFYFLLGDTRYNCTLEDSGKHGILYLFVCGNSFGMFACICDVRPARKLKERS
jgi:hypothetical protein